MARLSTGACVRSNGDFAPASKRINKGVRGLNVTRLDLNTGVGQTRVILPAHGKYPADISGGVGSTVVQIPRGVAARIHLSTGLGAASVSPVYERQGDLYVSPGYDSSNDRADLNIGGGIGQVTVQESIAQ